MTRRRRWLGLCAAVALAGPGAAAGADAGTGPAYLVYAGPYASSPSSAFGHLFLVLAARPADPPPLWDAVTFNAVTFDAGPIRYLTVGVFGGFLGRFDRFAFHQKTREYEVLDDRDLWLLELRLTPEERAALEQRLRATEGRWYPYSFFFRNCAFYLQRILAEATGALPAPGGVISPVEVFRDAQASRIAGATYHRPSASTRIAALATAAGPEARGRLRRSAWTEVAADVDWLSRLSAPERALAQEVFALRTLYEVEALPASTRSGLARLRLLAAQPLPDGAEAPPISGPGAPVAAPAFHGYPRVRLAFAAPEAGAPRLSLRFRSSMHDEADPWEGQPPASTLELLGFELSAPADRPELRVDSAVFFSQRALRPSDWVTTRTSWLLEALERRGGLFGASAPHFELRGGLGKTLELPLGIYVHGLVTAAAVGALGEGAALAPGLEAGVVALPLRRWRLGATWTREQDAFEWTRGVERVRAWTRLDLGRRVGLLLQGERGPGTSQLRVGVDLYL